MPADTYVLGRTGRESERLARQAALIEPETEALLKNCGVSAGMRVLDVGSGAGDVAILAGRLVGPDGGVTGVERSADSVALATRRATAAGVRVRFEVGDLDAYTPTESYDAVIGRFVLAYLARPADTLRRLAAHVRPGGVVAFMEFDVRQMVCAPEAPLFRAVAGWITRAFEVGGADPSLGSAIGVVFRDAGLPWPYVASFQKASCGPNGILWYFVELTRTLAPQIIEFGIATPEQLDIENLESRLQGEAIATGHTAFSPRWTGAWARLPR